MFKSAWGISTNTTNRWTELGQSPCSLWLGHRIFNAQGRLVGLYKVTLSQAHSVGRQLPWELRSHYTYYPSVHFGHRVCIAKNVFFFYLSSEINVYSVFFQPVSHKYERPSRQHFRRRKNKWDDYDKRAVQVRDLYPEDKLVIIAACGKLKLDLDLPLLVPFLTH